MDHWNRRCLVNHQVRRPLIWTANTITYTLTVKNNGGRAATEVDIFDAVPANATFVDITTVNGLLASNGDTYEDDTGTDQNVPADATTMYAPAALLYIDEPAGVLLDGDASSREIKVLSPNS